MEIRVVPEAMIVSAPGKDILDNYLGGKNDKKVCITAASPLMIQGNDFSYVVIDAPRPVDKKIKIKVVPPRKLAVAKCENYDMALTSLMGSLNHFGLRAAGRPFLIKEKNRDEIAIEIA